MGIKSTPGIHKELLKEGDSALLGQSHFYTVCPCPRQQEVGCDQTTLHSGQEKKKQISKERETVNVNMRKMNEKTPGIQASAHGLLSRLWKCSEARGI